MIILLHHLLDHVHYRWDIYFKEIVIIFVILHNTHNKGSYLFTMNGRKCRTESFSCRTESYGCRTEWFKHQHTHSNKHPGHLGKSFWVDTFVLIFVARINQKLDNFAHFQANSQLYWTQFVTFKNRFGWLVDDFMLYNFKIYDGWALFRGMGGY